MTTIDDALIVASLLNDNWNTGNVAKPAIYFDDRHISNPTASIKQHDFRTAAIKCYVVTPPIRSNGKGGHGPVDITHSYYQIETSIAVDMKTPDRNNYLAVRDEVNRVFESVRKTPNSNYQVLLFDAPQLVSGYAGFWHCVIKITLKHYGRAI